MQSEATTRGKTNDAFFDPRVWPTDNWGLNLCDDENYLIVQPWIHVAFDVTEKIANTK